MVIQLDGGLAGRCRCKCSGFSPLFENTMRTLGGMFCSVSWALPKQSLAGPMLPAAQPKLYPPSMKTILATLAATELTPRGEVSVGL